MIVKLYGKCKDVDAFIKQVKRIGKFQTLQVTRPEAYKFCRPENKTMATVKFFGNYLDFNMVCNKSFRSLKVLLQGEGFCYCKKAGSCKLNAIIQKPEISVRPKLNFDVSVEEDERLDEFETLELYEERIGRK